MRETTTKAVAEAQDAAAIAKKLAAEAKRTDSKTWARQKETNKEEQKLRAAIGKNTARARAATRLVPSRLAALPCPAAPSSCSIPCWRSAREPRLNPFLPPARQSPIGLTTSPRPPLRSVRR